MISANLEKNTLPTRQSLWQRSQALALPAAMWQLPRQTKKNFLTSFRSEPIQTKIDFEEIGTGFAFSPFENETGNKTFFLPADLHFTYNENEELEERINHSSENFDIFKLQPKPGLIKTKAHVYQFQSESTKHTNFISLVEKAINEIEAGKFQKVVLSRTKEMILANDLDLVSVFDKLCERYPNAFVSMVSLPHLGVIWIGASPEILVSQNAQGIFRTIALAGTQSAYDKDGNAIKPSEALWRQKEIEEQSFVTRYIINCLKKIRVREFEEEGPKTVIAGNLMHLRTDIIIDTVAINFPQLATVMLDLLHPTSAVCGMPKEAATEFILSNENYNREFYSGFLGPVNLETTAKEKESHIFVNLRTMKIQDNKATLYAGCGITADSNPEKEWNETEIKTQTLEKVLLDLAK